MQRDASNGRTSMQPVREYSLVMRRVDWTCQVVDLDNPPSCRGLTHLAPPRTVRRSLSYLRPGLSGAAGETRPPALAATSDFRISTIVGVLP